MNNEKRWKIAQESEKQFWNHFDKSSLFKRFVDCYSKKAQWLEKKIPIRSKDKILQVGGGAFDMINFLGGKRFAVDPLADFYKKKFHLDYKNIKFEKGVGESLHYKDGNFDVIILANMLDHVSDPKKVLSEVKRVLKPGGHLYLEVHVATLRFKVLAFVYTFFKRLIKGEIFNIHHPYIFTKQQITTLIKNRFSIISYNLGKNYYKGFNDVNDLKKAIYKDKNKFCKGILARLGFYGEVTYTVLCSKKEQIR